MLPTRLDQPFRKPSSDQTRFGKTSCAHKETPFFVFERDGAVVGLIGGLAPDESGVAQLVSMWIPSHQRGSGISDQLVEHIIAWAATEGSHILELSCTEGNTHAERLYMRHGFVRTGETETRERDGKVEFVMTLDISRVSGR